MGGKPVSWDLIIGEGLVANIREAKSRVVGGKLENPGVKAIGARGSIGIKGRNVAKDLIGCDTVFKHLMVGKAKRSAAGTGGAGGRISPHIGKSSVEGLSPVKGEEEGLIFHA